MNISKVNETDLKEISIIAMQEFPYANQTQEKIFFRKKNGSMIFKATENKKILGFIDFDLKNRQGTINALSVKKEVRGKKIGQKLARFAVNFLALKGAEKITLLVKRENTTAKTIYQKLGFSCNEIYEKKIENSLVEKMELRIEEKNQA